MCKLCQINQSVNSHLDDQGQRRSPNRRYQCWDRIWFPSQCVLGFQIQSFLCKRSFPYAIRILVPENKITVRNWTLIMDSKILLPLQFTSYSNILMCMKNTYFQTSLQDFFSFGTTDSAVNSNLFITTDTKRPDSVTCFGEHWLLSSQLFQHLFSQFTKIFIFAAVVNV